TPVSVQTAFVVPRVPASMKARSRWIGEMPTIAIASLILCALALTSLSHSGRSGWSVELQARREGLVAAADRHYQQVGDHHHVYQPSTISLIRCSLSAR